MSEYTKGPWRVEADMRPQFAFDYGESDNAEEYLAGWDIVSDEESIVGCEGIIPGEKSESNARLMAAAPDMLEALRQALTHIEADETTHGRSFAAGNVARTAISKALGTNLTP